MSLSFVLIVICVAILVVCAMQLSNGVGYEARIEEIIELDEVGIQSPGTRRKSLDETEDGFHQLLNKLYMPAQLRSAIRTAGISILPEEFMLIWLSAVMLPALIAYIISNNFLIVLIIAFLGGVLPVVYLRIKTQQRSALFATQLADTLQMLSNSLRSGFSFEQALTSIQKDGTPPASDEFGRAASELNFGMSLEDALNGVTERMQNTDMKLLTSAVLIQQKTGGNLANLVDTISGTIRERIKLQKNIKALTAQGRMSGYVIGALPVVLFILISTINPSYMSMFYTTTLGKALIVASIFLELIAFVIIKKMTTLS